MKYHKGIREAVLVLLSLAALASARYDWRWVQPQEPKQFEDQSQDIQLTGQNGSRAADVQYYNGTCARVAFEKSDHTIWVLPITNGTIVDDPVQPDPSTSPPAAGQSPCVAFGTSADWIAALWHKYGDHTAWCCKVPYPGLYDDWPVQYSYGEGVSSCDALALATGSNLGQDVDYTFACFRAEPPGEPDDDDGVYFNNGHNGPTAISYDLADQITMASPWLWSSIVLVAYHYVDNGTDKIRLWKSTNYGEDWNEATEAGSPWSGVAQPCLAVDQPDGNCAALCWVQSDNPTNGGKVYCCWSKDLFSSSVSEPEVVGGYSSDPRMTYNAPSISVVQRYEEGNYDLLLVSELDEELLDPNESWLSTTDGVFLDDRIQWKKSEHYLPNRANVADQFANPCVGACYPSHYGPYPEAYCFYAAPGTSQRALFRMDADYVDNSISVPPAQADGIGRRIWLDPDGTVSYAACAGANVHSGPIRDGSILQPILVSGGGLPALALGGDGKRWVSYLRDDTVWCMLGDGSYKAVFAGDGENLPGQPSITMYPVASGNGYVANVVFAAYDTAAGTSAIIYAKVDSSQVLIDTIATSGTAADTSRASTSPIPIRST